MSTALLRLIAALALGVQLAPLSLPWVCQVARSAAAADCAMPASHGTAVGSVGTASSDHPLCTNLVMCVTPTAIPSVAAMGLAQAPQDDLTALPLSAFSPAEPHPPLPPPPQA